MIKIMIAEDDKYLCEELIQTFRRKGYSASGISSLDDSASGAGQGPGPVREILDADPDLVILDVNLPGTSGYELCKRLKARATFPILILTAEDEVLWAVRNNGSGILPEDAPFIFDKGFTGSRPERQKATGMGLYLAKKYAQQLGARIELEPVCTSGTGFGIRVIFTL